MLSTESIEFLFFFLSPGPQVWIITIYDYLIVRMTMIKEFLLSLEISFKGLVPIKVIG